MADNAIDVIVRRVVEQVTAEATARFESIAAEVRSRAEAVFAGVEGEVQRRVDAALDAGRPSVDVAPAEPGIDPIAWIKAQAKSRALRTLIQGFVSAVVLAFLTALTQGIADPGFDITDASDWKIALGLGLGAIGTAIASLIQNKLAIAPPKV